MLQVYLSNVSNCFNTDVAKVDRDVVFVAMVCTRMLQVSFLNVLSVFQTYVVSVFYLDVAYVLHICGCWVCFAMCFECFSGVFFQVFHLASFICCSCCI
jgi:hypothetical protein